MSKNEDIFAMTRKEMAAEYRMSTKSLNRLFKRYGLSEEIKRSSLVPARIVMEFAKCHGHWKYVFTE